MNFFDFIGYALEAIFSAPGLLYLLSIFVGVGGIVGGIFVLIYGVPYVSDELGWAWNILFIPVMLFLIFLVFMFALWWGRGVLS